MTVLLRPTGLDITASEAMTSPDLFAAHFDGPSWDCWRSVVKAAFGEPMTDDELRLFREVAGREPPTQRIRELVAAIGRGGGKNSVISFLVTYLAATFDPRTKLRPGERVYALCIAVDKAQAKICYDYIRGYFEHIPALASLVSDIGSSSIELTNGVTIEVSVANFRSVRGRSILVAVIDEAAFLRDEAYANPDIELYNALSPGLARVPGSMMFIISSVHKRSGLPYQKCSSHFGKDSGDVGVKPSTPTPTVSRALGAGLMPSLHIVRICIRAPASGRDHRRPIFLNERQHNTKSC